MDVVSIASLKVTVRDVFGAIDEAESEGYVDETVGAVVSVVSLSVVLSVVLLFVVSSSAVVTALFISESLIAV